MAWLSLAIWIGQRVKIMIAWHPSTIQFTVTRTEQKGYHHRTDVNKKIYRMSAGYHMKNRKLVNNKLTTNYNLALKTITPMGGFPHRDVQQDFIMLKVSYLNPDTMFEYLPCFHISVWC